MSLLNFLFAWRYFKAKKSTNAINIISWISIIAVVIGTAALILVLSVFNGFEGLVKSLYSTFYTDLKISPVTGKTILITPAQIQKIKSLKEIKNYSLVVEEKALLQNGDYQSVVYLKGVDDNYRYTSGVAGHLVKGNYDLGTVDTPKLILGAGVENAIHILADRNLFTLKIYLPRKSNTEQINLLEDISADTINTSGTFLIQEAFDNKYGITNIDFVKNHMGFKADEYSEVELAVMRQGDEDMMKKKIESLLGKEYTVQTRYEQNSSLYSVMRFEKYAIFCIFILVLIVAAFNMIGALSMLVLEKQKDIQVLQAMGADKSWIRKVFLSEGILLAFIGAAAGMIMAALLCYIQIKFMLIPLEGASFIINYYPVKMVASDFLVVCITVFIIAMAASWYPSKRAAEQAFELRN